MPLILLTVSWRQAMKTRLLVLSAVAVALMFAAIPVRAHHSFAAEYDVNQPLTLKGTLSKMEWVNPHGWIYVDVKGADGKVTTWAVEAGAPNALLKRGLRASDFPVGKEVVVDGFRAKDGSATANGLTVKFPDGRNFFMGTQGNGAPPAPTGAGGEYDTPTK
jgi:hypothetical protein